MEVEALIWVLIGLMAMTLLVLAWIGTRLQRLEKARAKAVHDTPLSKDQLAKLRDEASQQYETTMVRELKRFEAEMAKMSEELLGKLRTQVSDPQAQLQTTINGLLAATTQGYQVALDEAVQQLRARLASVDRLIASHAEAADKAVQALVEERRTAALARLDHSLGEMFADYMTKVASGVDFGDQQELILQRLEAIKPQLLEDVKRA